MKSTRVIAAIALSLHALVSAQTTGTNTTTIADLDCHAETTTDIHCTDVETSEEYEMHCHDVESRVQFCHDQYENDWYFTGGITLHEKETTTAASETAVEDEHAGHDHDEHEATNSTTTSHDDHSSNSTTTTTTTVSESWYSTCHLHDSEIMCTATNGTEFVLECHAHETEEWCYDADGEEFLNDGLIDTAALLAGVTVVSTAADTAETTASSSGVTCHYHAGVEHCTGSAATEATCDGSTRDYNIPLRIGALFIILATSGIAVFFPVILRRFTKMTTGGIFFVVIKQFGTGVIISTALIHLLTHAQLMFASPCVGELEYEGTATSIVMAGIFIAFIVEYLGYRFVESRRHAHSRQASLTPSDVSPSATAIEKGPGAVASHPVHGAHGVPDEVHAEPESVTKLSVAVMEAGIVFHSILIGLTLVVAGDDGFPPLFVVIIFHQMFEGLALGARIAEMQSTISYMYRFTLCLIYCLITPIGCAIGIGVLDKFNGNDKSTLITLGTLDALSAGVLLYVGLVELLAHDWLAGRLKKAGILETGIALISLMAGMAVMSLLGKWA
ncbi:high-affinity Zn(2+) transporter zrt1 [Saitoella coloradoensis]